MLNFALLKRELKSAFDHPIAYILAVVMLGLLLFFGFRGIYIQGLATIRPIFDILPWFLTLYVPALTMRLFAEEKRSGTLEFLGSQPLTLATLVLTKIKAAALLAFLPVLLTLGVPLMLAGAGAFDWGQLFSQYLAAALLVTALSAIGASMSALSRNQVASFISAFALSFLLIIIGFEVVVAEYPGAFRGVLSNISALQHFTNITRGVLDLRDVFYFLSISVFFATLTYVALLLPRLAKSRPAYRRTRLGLVLVFLITILMNIVGGALPLRLDLTATQAYTVASATRSILGQLDTPISLKLFASTELPPTVATQQRDVLDLLQDFERAGKGKVIIENNRLGEGSDLQAEAQKFGIRPVQFNILEQEQFTLRQGYFGLAVVSGDEHKSINFIEKTGDLEYQIISFIRQLTIKNPPKIGLIGGYGTRADLNGLRTALGEQYQVQDVSLATDDLTPNKTLLIIGPTQAVPQKDQQKLRQYLDQGGALLALLKGVNVQEQYLTAVLNDQTLGSFFEPYGVKLNNELVYDLRANEQVSFGGGIFSLIVPYPYWVKAQKASEHAIVNRLSPPTLPWVSSITSAEANSDYKVVATTLLQTTPSAGATLKDFNLSPEQKFDNTPDKLSQKNLALALSISKTATAATNAPSARVVIVASDAFVADSALAGNPANAALALNAVDWLTQEDALLGIRAKQRSAAPLVFKAESEATVIRLVNLIGLPLIVVAFGVYRFSRRRQLTKKTYDPKNN